MSKPEDIPQDVWDAAISPAHAVYNDAFLFDDVGGSDGMYLDSAITTTIIARACNENPLSDKTKRGLQRAWDSWKSGNEVPLDKRLKGSSMEPGISREESQSRWLDTSVSAAMKLSEALTDLAAKSRAS